VKVGGGLKDGPLDKAGSSSAGNDHRVNRRADESRPTGNLSRIQPQGRQNAADLADGRRDDSSSSRSGRGGEPLLYSRWVRRIRMRSAG